jgi:hypothetical protein
MSPKAKRKPTTLVDEGSFYPTAWVLGDREGFHAEIEDHGGSSFVFTIYRGTTMITPREAIDEYNKNTEMVWLTNTNLTHVMAEARKWLRHAINHEENTCEACHGRGLVKP